MAMTAATTCRTLPETLLMSQQEDAQRSVALEGWWRVLAKSFEEPVGTDYESNGGVALTSTRPSRARSRGRCHQDREHAVEVDVTKVEGTCSDIASLTCQNVSSDSDFVAASDPRHRIPARLRLSSWTTLSSVRSRSCRMRLPRIKLSCRRKKTIQLEWSMLQTSPVPTGRSWWHSCRADSQALCLQKNVDTRILKSVV